MAKVAIVVQRYGEEILGGAEAHARVIAEALVIRKGWNVDVLTTTAKDYRTWKNEFDEGSSELNGVHVHRFHSLRGRSFLFGIFNRLVTPFLLKLGKFRIFNIFVRLFEMWWLIYQGPVNVKLARYLKENLQNYDRVFLFTYLYLPTIMGVKIAGNKAVLIPTAHDEPPFHFQMVRKMLNDVPVILANSVAEQRLLASKKGLSRKIRIAGIGFEPALRSNNTPFLGTPYILYLGRLSKGKNVDVLVSNFISYVQRTSSGIELVLCGKAENGFEIPHHPQIRCLGFVTAEEKNSLIYDAKCVVNPSPLESLSLLVLEAIVRERPVLVNKQCEVLRDYIQTCKSVLAYDVEEEFSAQLDLILRTDWSETIPSKKLHDAKQWAEAQYSWDKVLREYERCL